GRNRGRRLCDVPFRPQCPTLESGWYRRPGGEADRFLPGGTAGIQRGRGRGGARLRGGAAPPLRSRLPASGTPRGVPLLTSAGGWGPQNSAGPTPPDLAAGPPSSPPFVWTAPLSPVAGRLPASAATSPVPLVTGRRLPRADCPAIVGNTCPDRAAGHGSEIHGRECPVLRSNPRQGVTGGTQRSLSVKKLFVKSLDPRRPYEEFVSGDNVRKERRRFMQSSSVQRKEDGFLCRGKH